MTREKPPLPPPNGSRISTPPSPNMALRNPVFDSNSTNETASEKQSPFEDISSESSSVRHLSLDDPQSDSGLAAEDVTMNVCTLPPSRSITRDEFQDHVDKCDDQKLFEKEFKVNGVNVSYQMTREIHAAAYTTLYQKLIICIGVPMV